MCIASCLRWARRFLLATALAVLANASAHPVAQGALDVTVGSSALRVTVQVSNEEILVGSLHLGNAALPAATRDAHYAQYLLRHLQLHADGELLRGHLHAAPLTLRDHVRFVLDYPYRTGPPQQLQLRQDLLREFLFAPGNPWEARYAVRIAAAGQADAPTRLLLAEVPLRFQRRADGLAFDPADAAAPGLARGLVVEGIAHILGGYDHLLFVAALLLAVTRLLDLIKVISAFTVAHGLTLALAAFGLLRLPAAVVEPVIAASIVVIALQNLFWPRQSQGSARVALAFAFGLFHGLGYAGGLLDALQALSTGHALWAVAAFSLGVEIGHQIVIVPAYLGLRAWRRWPRATSYGRHMQRGASALVGLAGLAYLVAAVAPAAA